jgi:hypothetical protein
MAAREVKATRDSAKAERAAKVEVAAAVDSGEAAADVVEESPAE